MTQLDIIRRQAEAAARNQVRRAAAGLRRDTSLVGQASRLTGKAIQAGQSAGMQWAGRQRGGGRATEPTVPTQARPPRAAEDGYVRRSPVQPVYEAADYRRRLVRRGIGIAVIIVIIVAAVIMLDRLGVFAR